MSINYEFIKRMLDENYKQETGREKCYYLDENGKVVATLNTKDNTITTYFDDEFDVLESHFRKIALVFAKNLIIINNGEATQIDAMYIGKLLGRDNDARQLNRIKIEMYDNEELDQKYLRQNDKWPQQNIGSLGQIKEHKDGQLSFITDAIEIMIENKLLINNPNKSFNLYILSSTKPTIQLTKKETEPYINGRTYETLDEIVDVKFTNQKNNTK